MIITLEFPVGVVVDVVIVAVAVAVPLLAGVTELGLKPHPAPAGKPEQVNETALLNPFTDVMVIADVPD